MKSAVLILIFVLTSRCLSAAGLTDDQLKQIDFVQKVGATVSADLRFLDDHGRQVRLGDYFGKPTILVLGYYRCPMLCSAVLNGMISSLQDLKPSAGGLFDIIFVSIDPKETPALAAAKKANYVKLYGRPGTTNGWHFLTGSKASIETLAAETGYHYAYDPASGQFAHPSGLIILTANGKITRYFFGIGFPPDQLDTALRDADSNRVESVAQQFVYLCFHYNPIRGKYGHLIMTLLRVGAVGTIAGIGGFLFVNLRGAAGRKAGS